MTPPFATYQTPGIVWVDRARGQAFRNALMNGVPPSLRGKMREALAATPGSDAAAHSKRFFGDELVGIMKRVTPLLIELEGYLTNTCKVPGFWDWLDITNFGNDYRMIKVFAAWAEMPNSKVQPGGRSGLILPNG